MRSIGPRGPRCARTLAGARRAAGCLVVTLAFLAPPQAETAWAQIGHEVTPADLESYGQPADPGPTDGDPGQLEAGDVTATEVAGRAVEEETDRLAPTHRPDGYRSEIEAAWFSGGPDLARRAHLARRAALRLGVANVESAARALLRAPGSDEQRLDYARLAVELAPDIPSVRMALAIALLQGGELQAALSETVAGLAAIPRNLEAALWFSGSLVAMLAAVLVAGPMLFILCVGLSVFRHAAHDLGDLISGEMPDFARAALLASLLLVPVMLGEFLMGVTLAFFALGFMYAPAGGRRALALAGALLLLGLYPLTRATGIAISSLDADPIASAAHAVLRGFDSEADVELLARVEEQDTLARYVLALRERRIGNQELALERHEELLADNPTDPFVLAALANMHFENGEHERAIQLSERAAGLTSSATLLFNLSQVYARSFRMDEFENAMAHAQSIDSKRIADLSQTAEPEFVADLSFDVAPIWHRLLEHAGGQTFVGATSRVLMPGRLGASWIATAGGFALVALLSLILTGRFEQASTCGRCGQRICARCDGTVWNNEICDGCHHLFHRPETTDPKMRLARLSQLRERESRVGRIALVSSLLLPGAGGLLARRPDLSFLGLLFFACGVALFVWREGIVVDPLAVGAAGPLVFMLAGATVCLCYASVVAVGLWVRRSL